MARHEGSLAQYGSEVAGRRIGYHFARIVSGTQTASDEFVETELFRPCHIHGAVDRRSHGDRADSGRDVLSCHRLDQDRGQTHCGAHSGRVGGALGPASRRRRPHNGCDSEARPTNRGEGKALVGRIIRRVKCEPPTRNFCFSMSANCQLIRSQRGGHEFKSRQLHNRAT